MDDGATKLTVTHDRLEDSPVTAQNAGLSLGAGRLCWQASNEFWKLANKTRHPREQVVFDTDR